MTYTFKLSRRLAVARIIPVAALAFGAAACDVVDPLDAAAPGAGELQLSPARATAEPNQQIKLAFRDQTNGAATASFDVEWTVIGGAGVIAPDGSFTATQPGVYTIIGSKGKGSGNGNGSGNSGQGRGNGGPKNQTDTSVVVVVPPPPALVGVELTPASASIQAGEHLQFDAVGRDANGATVAIGVEWSATGGTIDGGGHFIAGSDGGDFRVVAKHASSGYADTAVVTVAVAASPSPAPNPPPPPSDGDAPGGGGDGGDTSAPSGFSVISDRRFDAKIEDGWGDRGDSHFSIVRKSSPSSPDNVGQAIFPRGFPSGSGPISTALRLGNDKRELLVRFDVQLSSNWDGNDAGVNKIFFIWMHGKPVVCLSAQGSGSNPLMAQVRLQNTPAGARNLSPNLASGRIERGKWVKWEILLIANTPGRADGEIHWSIDGVKVGQYTDVILAGAGEANVWENLQWNPTYGGAGEAVAEDQFMWMDHVFVAGR